MRYKDYIYEPEEDCDGDCVKRYHDVYELDIDCLGQIHGKNKIGSMPLGPYSRPTIGVFAQWIECGMPTREDIKPDGGNPDCKDIVEYYIKWVDHQIDMAILGDEDV